jgi:hypothetical protein
MIAAEAPRCEICSEPAVATGLRDGTETQLCAIHLALSDPVAAALYAEIARLKAGEKE